MASHLVWGCTLCTNKDKSQKSKVKSQKSKFKSRKGFHPSGKYF